MNSRLYTITSHHYNSENLMIGVADIEFHPNALKN